MRWDSYHSPLGPLTLVADEQGLHEVRFPGRARDLDPADRDPDSLSEVVDQMEEYFARGRQTFEVTLDVSGTAFQQRVWRALQDLPYGAVATYGDIARALGVDDSGTLVTGERRVTAAQKVGWAIGANPTPIVVPCHRVVGADGSLTGYRGGLQRKRALLDLEAAGVGGARFRDRQGQLALPLIRLRSST
jgi:methylated-DNA-[protein]-cysteine S-methyltransferase